MTAFISELNGVPAIIRDVPPLKNPGFLDGSWTRFYNGKPKKIGGYNLIYPGVTLTDPPLVVQQITRDIYEADLDNYTNVYLGTSNKLEMLTMDPSGQISNVVDRTPAPETGFVPDANNTWTFAEVVYLDGSGSSNRYIIAAAVPNLTDIGSDTEATIFFGPVDVQDTETSPLVPIITSATDGTAYLKTSGGITVLGNIIMNYTRDGGIYWNCGTAISYTPEGGVVPEGITPPSDGIWPVSNNEQIGTSNFVYGAPVRNGDVIGGLFWGVVGVVKTTLITGGDNAQPLFDFSYISPNSSLLSSSCVVYYDPYFYWIGKDTFWMYNGTVQEIPNQQNKLFFFNNLNPFAKNKVFGFFNSQYQEVWWGWCNSSDSNNPNENNSALILKKEEQNWFDTDQFNRACGVNDSALFPYPLLAASLLEPSTATIQSYPIWQHEIGVNKVNPLTSSINIIVASIQYPMVPNPNYLALVVDDLILDIIYTGPLTVNVLKQGYPGNTPLVSPDYTFQPGQGHITMREKGNMLSLIFTSNAIDGDFYFGTPLLKLTADETERPGPVDIDDLLINNLLELGITES